MGSAPNQRGWVPWCSRRRRCSRDMPEGHRHKGTLPEMLRSVQRCVCPSPAFRTSSPPSPPKRLLRGCPGLPLPRGSGDFVIFCLFPRSSQAVPRRQFPSFPKSSTEAPGSACLVCAWKGRRGSSMDEHPSSGTCSRQQARCEKKRVTAIVSHLETRSCDLCLRIAQSAQDQLKINARSAPSACNRQAPGAVHGLPCRSFLAGLFYARIHAHAFTHFRRVHTRPRSRIPADHAPVLPGRCSPQNT